jgi:hypothetical protein
LTTGVTPAEQKRIIIQIVLIINIFIRDHVVTLFPVDFQGPDQPGGPRPELQRVDRHPDLGCGELQVPDETFAQSQPGNDDDPIKLFHRRLLRRAKIS